MNDIDIKEYLDDLSNSDRFKEMFLNEIFKPVIPIEVRAWHPEDRVMIYDLNSPRLLHGKLCGDDDYILMQYTTLNDVNNRKIYHGDILLLDENIAKIIGADRRYVLVGFKDGSWMCGIRDIPLFMTTYLWVVKDKCEVVGNIFENGNLLEAEIRHDPISH